MPARESTKFSSMATANEIVAMITIFWNFGVTRMLKNLYAASVTPAAANVASTAWATMPGYRVSKNLLNMPMKMPSMAAYTSTKVGLITRRNDTTRTTTKPTRPDRISAGSISVFGMANQASAALRIITAMVMAVLVTTSSKVI